MNLLAQGARPPLDALREQWRSASLSAVWRHADDWYHPSVDTLLEALSQGSPTEPACESLGFARAVAACGIGEAIDDLTCLFTTISHSVPVAAIRSLTLGWVDGVAATTPPMSCIDAASGLHSLEYFIVRLREIYETHDHSSQRSALLFIDVGLENLPLWERVARSAGMGQTLAGAFGAGRPIAALGGGCYVTLAAPADSPDTAGQALSRRIERSARDLGISDLLRRPPRVWREALPPTHLAATALLTARRRRQPAAPGHR